MGTGPTSEADEPGSELDAIAALKASYCQLLDAKDWDRWESLFTADAVMQVGPDAGSTIVGRAAIRRLLARQLLGARTHHRAEAPLVQQEAPGRYRVLWEMSDRVQTPLYLLRGAGFYEDRYVQTEERLKIASVRLHRSQVDLQPRSVLMRAILRMHRHGWLARLAPGADRTLREALHVGLEPGARP